MKATSQGKESENTGIAFSPVPTEVPPSESGQPGGGQGRIDVTGIIPEGIRIDPNLTEGHPGYEESGDSEIIPPKGSTGGTSAPEGEAG
jgi:hypothetical protein